MGRTLQKSSSYKVMVNPNYKWEGTESIKFREYSNYSELITPYENIYFAYMSNPKLITNIFLNMETTQLHEDGRWKGNGKKVMTNNKYIVLRRTTWWNKGMVI
jgi:hypothetical protein